MSGASSPVPGGPPPTEAPPRLWHGYERRDFVAGGRACILVLPRLPAPGRPWIWRTEFFGHEPQADLALLGHGFHVGYVDVQDMYGAPVAMGCMDAFYEEATRRHGLAPKVALEGFSRGGLFAYNWAARHPDRVACLYADAPVCDFRNWPAGRGRGPGSPADWAKALAAYGMTEEEALAWPGNPVDNLGPLAAADIPLLHVCGEADEAACCDENTGEVERRYRALGGSIAVLRKPFCRHHPHSLRNPAPIVRFVLRAAGLGAAPVRSPGTPFGYDYFVLRAGLRGTAERLRARGTGRVAFLGGSITAAAGWRDMVSADLRRRFPGVAFDFVQAGVPSLGSVAGAFRFARDVLGSGPVDLLFVDAAVNDEANGCDGAEQIRGMEGIVRHARRVDPGMGVVLLHFADPPKLAAIRAGRMPDVVANHERVAERYGLPSADCAQEVAERIAAGELTWSRDFVGLHPSPLGHRLYAEAVGRLLDDAWGPCAPGEQSPEGTAGPPLDPASYDRGCLVDPGAARPGPGWVLHRRWRPSDGAGVREGFVDVPVLEAGRPGAALRLAFEGDAVGVFVVAGPDAGRLSFAVDGRRRGDCELHTEWSPGLHLPWARVLAHGLPPGRHELELEVAAGAHPASRGHAVRIVHFLVNGRGAVP